jgi:hypothetical protein
MSEGTVVVIAGKRDQRVRNHEEKELHGTVVKIEHGKVWVMLPDGDLWVGEDYQVYPKQEEEECTTN